MLTFPTNSCVRVSRPEARPSDAAADVAICMTASICEFEGGTEGTPFEEDGGEGEFWVREDAWTRTKLGLRGRLREDEATHYTKDRHDP